MKALLAADPALPQRDVLLDARAAGRAVQACLAPSLRLTRCEVVRVKYRIGESLRVRYRVEADGREYIVACRMFPPGAGERAFLRARERAVPAGDLAAVAWEPALETVFWTFPNDRKLRMEHLDGFGAFVVVAYAPEKSATVRAEGVAAYAKVYAGDESARTLHVHERLTECGAPVPRALAHAPHLLVVEAVCGRPLTHDPDDLRALGAALARFHELEPVDALPFTRLDPERIAAAVDVVSRARPESAFAAHALGEKLARNAPAGEHVCLHGDLHPKNVLVDDGVTLIDLDQVAAGPPAADLGSVIAGLRYAERPDLVDGLLAGYGSVRPLPSVVSLRWHTAAALLAERALRAVNRVRPEGLRRLRALLADGASLLDG